MKTQSQPSSMVVVVNDDPLQLEFLESLLQKLGYLTQTFRGAEAALSAMSRQPAPALLITDLYMPGIDGWRFCRLMRSPEYASLNQVPILVNSATFSGQEATRIAIDLGAEAFLSSPVNGQDFSEQVQAIMQGRRLKKPLRVLIVEDSKTQSLSLRKAFTSHGYQTETASTILEACAVFSHTAFDIAVLDYYLPDGTGDVLLDKFQATRPDCVCLMITSDTGPQMALDWMRRGAAAYLRKPFSPGYLLELCAKARRERALLRVQDLLEVRTRELRKSEEEHRLLVEHLDAGVVVYGSDARLRFANEQACRLLGLTQADTLDKQTSNPAWNFVREDGSSLPLDEYPAPRIIATLKPFRGEVIGISNPAATDLAWALASGYPVFDEFNSLRHVVITFADITQRKKADEELRILWRAVEQTPATVLITDSSGKIEYTNPKFVETTGYSVQEALGQNPRILKSGAHPPEFYKAMWDTLLQGKVWQGEICNKKKTGQLYWESACISAIRNGNGEITHYVAIKEDVTSRRQAALALLESESLLRESQKTANLGSYALHIPSGRWKSSAELDKLLGIDESFQRSVAAWLSLIHPDDRDMMADHLRNEVIGQRKTFDREYRILRHDNQGERWVHGLGKLQFDADGTPVNLHGTIQDIGERKRAEDEKARLESLLRQSQKMESVGRLAGGVAHDFNNMLHAILGNVYLAQEDLPPNSPARTSLEEIQNCAQRAADLTRQLLAFARRQTIVPKILDLNDCVEGLLKLLRRLIGESTQLVWLPTANLGSLKMDPTQIDQILANLCVNARDAIDGVGKITIETGKATFDDAYCARNPGFAPGDYLLLSVSDTGCGMDKETLTHIFEPFFTTKGIGKGTGLGLATLYGIVRQNSGFVHVDSKPGEGTTFRLYLPRYTVQAAVPGADTTANLPLSSGETVLLVEDEPAILAVAWKFLQRLGYTVLHASTPGEAIRLAATHSGQIHLLMTDVVMPEMNGRDLARQVLTLHPELKYMFMSGYTADIVAHHGVMDHEARFIQKPFSIEDLAVKVREVLDARV